MTGRDGRAEGQKGEPSGRGMIAGICGGLQMLGRRIADPYGLEGGGEHEGLGLLPVVTVLQKQKTLLRTDAICLPSELPVRGYEIHHGESDLSGAVPAFVRTDGGVSGCQSCCVAGDAGTGRVPIAGLGRIWGTYLHGVFDTDLFRRRLLDQLRISRGWEPVGKVVRAYDLEPAFERLADTVRAGVDLTEIYRMIGLR